MSDLTFHDQEIRPGLEKNCAGKQLLSLTTIATGLTFDHETIF
jgi:hypothetical protein